MSESRSSVLERIDQLCDRYEDARLVGQRPRIDDYLREVPEAERSELLRELLRLERDYLLGDQRRRWQQGERVLVQAYLEEVPSLRDYPELVFELVCGEVLLREDVGEKPRPADYLTLVPRHQTQLRRFFAARQLLPPETLQGMRDQLTLRAVKQATLVEADHTVDELPPASAPEPAPPAPERPTTMGEAVLAPPGYKILGELGRGGMGVVYQARQVDADRLVALKMILAGGHVEPDRLARFRTEAEAIARLQHPYVVQIFEVGEHNGLPFFSLEFCPGGSLDKKLAGTPMQPKEAATLVAQVAQGVQAAHEAKVLHRDLKPANVLLAADATPKVTDFGLAKKLDAQGITIPGIIMGTPSYMAPEQASGQGHELGPAVDVYALGAILYECLTGRPPFRAATVLDTLRQVVSEEPVPPRQLNAQVARDLETICLKCLHKEAGKRYGSAAELADDLGRFLRCEPIHARRVGSLERGVKWMRRHPTMTALFLVMSVASLALLIVVLSYNLRMKTTFDLTRRYYEESRENLVRLHVSQGTSVMNAGDGFTALLWFTEALRLDNGTLEHKETHRERIAALQQELPKPKQLLVHEGAVNDARFSPDGSTLLTAGEDGKVHLWNSETGQELVEPPLSAPSPVVFAVFSRDGRRIAASCRDGSALIWDIAPPRSAALVLRVRGGEKMNWIDFSPDGQQLVTASGKAARVWDVGTGKPFPGELRHNGTVSVALFSPDGKWIATGGDDSIVHLWNSADRKPSPIVLSHDRAVLCLAFSPDSKYLASGSADYTAQVWNVADGTPVGRRVRHRDRVIGLDFGPVGERLLTNSEDGTAQIWRVVDGEPLVPPLRHKSVIRWTTFSPDGCRVATAGDDKVARVWSATSGSPLTPPLRANGSFNHVAFSPDGRCLATASDDGTARLWAVACQHRARVVNEAAVFRHRVDRDLRVGSLGSQGADAAPLARRTSPDGRLVIKIGKDNTARVYDVQSDKPVAPPLAHQGEIAYAAFSPDGHRIVTTSLDQTARVWDTESGAPASPLLRHASAVLFADFNPDGRRLVTASDDNTARIWDIATGEMLVPPLRHDGTVVQAVFSADGQRVATGSLDQTARVWDADTGQTLTPPLQHPWSVRQVRFDTEGTHLLTSGSAGALWSWDLPTTDCAFADLARLAQLLSGSRIDEHRGMMPLSPVEQKELWTTLQQTQKGFFHSSAEQVSDWHRQTAEECVRGRHWSAALWHLDRLVQQQPDNWLYHARRGEVHAQLGHWKEAGDDFTEVVRHAPDEIEARCLYAVLCLREGDLAGYRRACADLLKQSQPGRPESVHTAYLTAWTCVLSSDSGVKAERLVELAKQAVEREPGDPDYLCTLGAALFRAGDLKSAPRRLNEAQTIHGVRPCPHEWLWLSIVHGRMGSPREARKWLEKATASLHSPDAASLPWVQRVQLELLRHEAEGLLKEK
jgi:WD40 repeat protein/serine/threonine protein kinase/Flp pilus assembly protein TadD